MRLLEKIVLIVHERSVHVDLFGELVQVVRNGGDGRGEGVRVVEVMIVAVADVRGEKDDLSGRGVDRRDFTREQLSAEIKTILDRPVLLIVLRNRRAVSHEERLRSSTDHHRREGLCLLRIVQMAVTSQL